MSIHRSDVQGFGEGVIFRAERGAGAVNGAKLREMVEGIFEDVHSQRLDALGRYAAATIRAMRAGVHAIGAAYAETAEIRPKHGVKSFDRFLSNPGLDVEELRPAWARFVLGGRPEVLVALDWTEFDDDDHATLCLYVVTTHGRATPLAWKTHKKSELANRRTSLEHAFIESVHAAIGKDIGVTLLADRGFGDQAFYDLLEVLGWRYVIRFRGAILVEHEGVQKKASAWVAPHGRATKLVSARVTADKTQVGAVVVVRGKKMKEPWILATNLPNETARQVVKLYGRRFTIEETFRDEKDLRFGMGLRATHIRSAARRDRLLMVLAIAIAFLTLLGAASERAGMDAWLRVNTVKTRTHSLFRQGSYWYRCLPTMRPDWFTLLMDALALVIEEHQEMTHILGKI